MKAVQTVTSTEPAKPLASVVVKKEEIETFSSDDGRNALNKDPDRNFSEKLIKLESDLKVVTRALEEKDLELSTVRQDNIRQMSTFNAEKVIMSSTYDARLKDLQNSLASTERSLSELKQKYSEKNAAYVEIESALTNIKSERSELQKTLAMREQKLIALEDMLSSRQTDIFKLQEELDSEKTMVYNAQIDKSVLLGRFQQLQEAYQAQEAELKHALNEHEELQKSSESIIRNLQLQSRSAVEMNIKAQTDCANQTKILEEKIDGLLSENQMLREKVLISRNEAEQWSEKYRSASQKVAERAENDEHLRQQDLTSYEMKLLKAKSDFEETKQYLQTEVDALNKQLVYQIKLTADNQQNYQSAIAEKERLLSFNNEEISTLKLELERTVKLVKDSRELAMSNQQKWESVATEIRLKADSEHRRLLLEKKSLMEQVANLQQDYGDLHQRYTQLLEEVESANKTVNISEVAPKEADIKLSSESNLLASLRLILGEDIKGVDDILCKITQIQQSRDHFHVLWQESSQQVLEAQKDYSSLEDSLDDYIHTRNLLEREILDLKIKLRASEATVEATSQPAFETIVGTGTVAGHETNSFKNRVVRSDEYAMRMQIPDDDTAKLEAISGFVTEVARLRSTLRIIEDEKAALLETKRDSETNLVKAFEDVSLLKDNVVDEHRKK
ncbi:hypothetical protein HDV05_008348, partial [Chytridiales sp. JEL 0842]